jgi:predicted phage terminase large subunit-like protein
VTALAQPGAAARAVWLEAAKHLSGERPTAQAARSPGELALALDPKTIQTPALRLIDDALVDVAEGRETRLMVSLAPQEGKSERTSRRFPLWMLMRNPELRIAIISYAHRIARRWGRTIRDDIGMHGRSLGGLRVNPASAAAHEWELAGHRGGVYSTGIQGSLTSRAVDLLIIDDPYKDGKWADSDAWRETVQDFWTGVAIPRLGPKVAVVIIQTRWRHDDMAGWLQTRPDGHRWRVINIPAQADHDPSKGQTDPLGRQPGQYMQSTRGRTVEDWEQRKREMGSRDWLALCQGRPSPAKGSIFNRDWWKFYDTPQWVIRPDGSHWALSFDELVISWDMSFKKGDETDFVCGQVWGRRGVDLFLLDQSHARMTFTETLVAFRQLAARWPQAVLKLVEDKANGPAVIDSLRRKIAGIVAVEPRGSKIERASAVSPFVESGNVYLPDFELCPWSEGFVEEAQGFPRAAHDDRVDAFSQAADRLLLAPLLAQDETVGDPEQDEAEGSISPY